MDKVFNPLNLESKWYQFWEEHQLFKPSQKGQTYCIMLPPPNVTGSLHMGHAFQDTLMDMLIRYHRMKGDDTLWQGGTDHAGIATQMVVERQLAQQNVTRHDLGRDAFVGKVWEWKAQSGDTITQQMRSLGASLDWSRQRFTMDEGLSEAVKEVFVRLYDEGLIYKGKRLVNWDPKLHTAVSDLEVVTEEEQGNLWHIRYPISGEDRFIVVATTRPETMLGDTAVAVHPDDPRYQDLIGQYVQLPLTDRLIPIIADDYVDPEFGTGCVKITPAHDFNDYEVGVRHGLSLINIFDNNAHINRNAPMAYQGMERYQARDQIVKDLSAKDLIEKIDPHTMKVPRGDRSGVVIEPYLTDQWYVKVKPLAEKAIQAVEQGEIQFVPNNWTKTYFEWMNNIQDWCISRQLWWGHRIPAWTDKQGEIYVARDEQEVRSKYNLSDNHELTQDPDVLDTWFSSALWPFSTLGWPEKTPEFDRYYPTQVLVTGFDIIFFWVARMIMFGYKFTGKRPFSTVYVHGLIQDPEGQKMSKSKGNILDPLDLIHGIELEPLIQKRTTGLMQPEMANRIKQLTQKQFPDGIPSFGTDALRFTFLSLATHARHIRFDLHRIEGYRNFCNKVWNAARYVLMNCENDTFEPNPKDLTFSLADRWIVSKLQGLKKDIAQHIEDYRFDLLASSVYEFIWNHYCDWYLELSKPVLNSAEASESQIRGTRYTLLSVLEELMRLLHPLMPYITEEIWQRVAPKLSLKAENTSVMMQSYPSFDKNKVSVEAEASLEWIKTLITGIRNIRGEMNISPNKSLTCLCLGGTKEEMAYLKDNASWIQALAKLETLSAVEAGTSIPTSATALAGGMEIFIPLKGLVDVQEENKRLAKEIEKHQKEAIRSEAKLNNTKYVSNAPEEIVLEERRRLEEAQNAVARLNAQLEKLKSLS